MVNKDLAVKKLFWTKACRFDRNRKVSSPKASSVADDIKGLIFQANELEYYYSLALQNIIRFTYSPNKAIDETSRFQPLLKKILYL